MTKKEKVAFAMLATLFAYISGIFTKKKILTDKADEIDVLARTIWGEARGEGFVGMHAVACVVRNRVNAQIWFGRTYAEVCKKQYQFSCWLASDPNYNKCLAVTANDSAFQNATNVATGVINDAAGYEDITGGANHFHTKNILPAWAEDKEPCAIIGNHVFYKL